MAKPSVANRPLSRLPRFSFKLALTLLWLGLTMGLAGWWLVFGLRQIDRIATLNLQESDKMIRQHHMIMLEGGVLFLLLLLGGLALFYYIYVEMQRSVEKQNFFSAFSHDLKTSLAALRLQAEAIEEDLAGKVDSRSLKRLLKDTVRLELQLENSLFIGNDQTGSLFLEKRSLTKIVEGLSYHWPEMEFEVVRDAELEIDRRASESIFKNLVQNAIVHGKATKVSLSAESAESGRVLVTIHDNGQGFQGDHSHLSKPFTRHATTSGTGLGLYIAKSLCARHKGRLEFVSSPQGFAVKMDLPGRLLGGER